MKLLLLLCSFIVATMVKGQATEQDLKLAVIKAENENYLKKDKDAKIISSNVIIYKYSLIPLKDWWKRIYDVHNKFALDMDTLFLMYKTFDSNHVQKHDSTRALKQNGIPDKTSQSGFDGRAYFKKKYESTDPAIKVYEVLYLIDLKAPGGNGYYRDSVRMCLYPKDLSEVKSF